MLEALDEIARRTLDLVDDAGRPAGNVTVRIGRPTQETTGEWGDADLGFPLAPA